MTDSRSSETSERARRAQAEADVFKKASLFDLIIESAPDAIISADKNGVIQMFSPAAEAMFGYSAEEVIGQSVTLLMPEPYRSEHDGYMDHYMTTGERRIIGIGREIRAQRKNGDVFPAELAVGELQRDGETIFTGFLRDVGDRVAAEKKAARLQRALDRLSRIQMLGEMSTALAHEVNQPLAAIANYATAARRLLLSKGDRADEAAAFLDQIAAEARRAGDIVKGMRTLVDRGVTQFKPEDVNAIVHEATRLGMAGVGHDAVKLHFDLGDGLPSVNADRVQIQQVIVNLLRNSVEAIIDDEAHEIHVETALVDHPNNVNVSLRRNAPDEVMVTVRDDGPGLPEDALSAVFEPFFSRKPHNIGVGLAICRSIIHAHGGCIWAENNPEGGASFHFTLKATEDPNPRDPGDDA